MNIAILAAGDFPTHPIPLQALRNADYIVCCDSAYSHFSIFNFQFSIPFVVIGDGDSLTEETKRELGDRWIHVAEQDYNDLHKAMAWIMAEVRSKRYEAPGVNDNSDLRITILGATGKREDHTLGNISYLVTFAMEYPGIKLEMLTDYGSFRSIAAGTHTFPSFPGQQVSLFAMDPTVALSCQELRWPLQDFHPLTWWQATLNEALAHTFTLASTGWSILFQTYEPKA